jgi:glycosyltransferase involved in cell wall biosynthesis
MTRPDPVLYLETGLGVGGSVISLYELLKGLDRTRYEPIVVTYANHAYVDKFRALGAEVIVWDAGHAADHRPKWAGSARSSLPARLLRKTTWGTALYHGVGLVFFFARRLWPRAQALRRIIVEKQVKLVHTNIRVGHDREGIIAAWLAGRPCVCHIRHFESLGWFDRRLAALVSRFIYISEAVQKSHLQSGVPCRKGLVVYNGLDVPSFVMALDAEKGRRSFDLGPDDLVVGMVGRLDAWKGYEVFIRAMAQVKDKVPQVKGIVVGEVAAENPGYLDVLRTLRNDLALAGRVEFSGFRMDIPVVMSALDILVLASTSPEPFGRVLIEAMAAGKPVVATDAGAAREIIEDGVQGLLVPAGDAEAMARAITDLLTHRDTAILMGQKGQNRVRERFGMQQYSDGVQSVYRELLASPQSRRDAVAS